MALAAFWSDFGYLIVTAVVVVLVFRVLLQLSTLRLRGRPPSPKKDAADSPCSCPMCGRPGAGAGGTSSLSERRAG